MSQDGEQNIRKRKLTDSPPKMTMFHNLITTISPYIPQSFTKWLRKRGKPNSSDHMSGQNTEAIAPPTKKRKWERIHTITAPHENAHPQHDNETIDDEDITECGYEHEQENSESEETLNRRKRKNINDDDSVVTPAKSLRSNVSPHQLAHYNSLSSTNLHERTRQIMASTSSAIMQCMNRENLPALNHDYSMDRSVSVHRPFSFSHQIASRRTNYYKTRDLLVPTQASIMLVKNNYKRGMTVLPLVHASNAECEQAGPHVVPGPSEEVGPTEVAGPSEEAGPTEVAGSTEVAGPIEVAGPSEEASPSELAGPTEEAGPTEQACPTEHAGPSAETEPNGVPGSSGGVRKIINFDDDILSITEQSERSDTNEVGGEKQPDNAFTKIILASSEKWQCSVCLVRNLQSLARCGCCGGLKPGSQRSVQQNETPKFNFGIQTTVNIGFKSPTIPELTSSTEESPASQPIVSQEMSLTSTSNNTNPAANNVITPEPTTALNPAANSEPTAAPVATYAITSGPVATSTPTATPAYIPTPTPSFIPTPTPSFIPAPIPSPTPDSTPSIPNTHSSIKFGNGNNENMQFVFGVPNVNMNTCGMQIPAEMKLPEIGNMNRNDFFSSTKPCVNIFGSGLSQVNTIFKSEARPQMDNVFSTPTFNQPAPRPPAPGPVFSFGQLQTQSMQAQTQPMQAHTQPMQAQTQPMQIQTQPQPHLVRTQTYSADPTSTQLLGLQSSQPSQSGVYNFSGNQTVPQFNIGSSPILYPTARKIRKAVRRSNVR